MDSQAAGNPRRPGALAVHSLHRFVFSVPDLGEAATFYRAFGLDVRETDGHLDLHTFGHPHRWGSIYQRAGPKRFEYVSFGAYADDFDALVATTRTVGNCDHEAASAGRRAGRLVRRSRRDCRRDRRRAQGVAGGPARGFRCSRSTGCRRGAQPFPSRYRAATAAVAHPAVHARRVAVGAVLRERASGCASPIARATSSRSSMARTPATTTCSRSRNPMVPACIIHRGTSRRSTRSASACSRWPIAATRMAGALAGT